MQNNSKEEILQKLEDDMRRKEIDEMFKSLFLSIQELFRHQVPEKLFDKKLIEMVELCKQWLAKLSDQRDNFVKSYHSYVETYKDGLKEFKELLLIMQKIEAQKNQLKGVRINSYQQQHGPLLSEIKFSEKRLQRMRAGVKLAQVLEESLKRKYEQVRQINIEQMEQIQKMGKEETIDQSDLNLIQDLDEGFQKQKEKVNRIVRSSYKMEKDQMNFEQKYQKKYFQQYFKERYKLANFFLGDELIKRFLDQNQAYMSKKLKENSNASHQASQIDKNFIKDLDAKNFITQDDIEGNGRALQKILRINKEIKEELLEEDHLRNLQEINQFEIQQKQTYWEKVLSQDEQFGNRKTTPNLKRQISVQPRSIEKRTISVKRVSSLKKRTIFYQAHPNFPIIQDTYNQDTHVPEQRLKRAAIAYEIENKPDHVLQPEDELMYPQQPPLRTPQTATTMALSKGFFTTTQQQPFFSRNNYQQFKSLTNLCGDKWNNY